ncbi:hypothetical protein [Paractinoplanes rishiriensis]|uniref:Uncharacterized protein n=1 Tax=Paractinoplanes rishiriensis TaxID=1050105 RepID=A0A919K3F2_9ACTN|nr:hypothetical protein [Actinoplanes rishiriensis]GIE99493.1 hypothetical protein Ari01nite_69580 [Actinoplanes rishiriensis]
MFTIPNLALLDIAPAVAALLGCEQAITHLYRTAETGYVCTVCGEPANLTDTAPAAVVVLAYPDGPHVVRLAHAGCSDSGIIAMTDDPTDNPAVLFPAMAWLRPADTTPAPVVVIAPRIYGMRVAANGDTTDTLTANLLGYGFDLLSHPEAPMPDLDAATAYLGADATLTLTDVADEVLWSGVLDLPDAWTNRARADRRIGVIFAAGLALDGDGDRLADLFTAIGDGRAVAACVELDTATAEPI